MRAEPVTNTRVLELVFNFPHMTSYLQSKPDRVISYIIEFEGRGSLLSYLKSTKHWVDSLNAYPMHINAGTGLFIVSLHLTKEGLSILNLIGGV